MATVRHIRNALHLAGAIPLFNEASAMVHDDAADTRASLAIPHPRTMEPP